MRQHDLSKLAAAIEELQRDWPLLVADEHLGPCFSSLLDDEELEEMLQEFIVPVTLKQSDVRAVAAAREPAADRSATAIRPLARLPARQCRSG